jgi:hypothetical protein
VITGRQAPRFNNVGNKMVRTCAGQRADDGDHDERDEQLGRVSHVVQALPDLALLAGYPFGREQLGRPHYGDQN